MPVCPVGIDVMQLIEISAMPRTRHAPQAALPAFFFFGNMPFLHAARLLLFDDRSRFQKRLIDTFVNAVFVYDDKLILTYNYQHGTQKITLKEVDDFLGSDLVGLSPPHNFDFKEKFPSGLF